MPNWTKVLIAALIAAVISLTFFNLGGEVRLPNKTFAINSISGSTALPVVSTPPPTVVEQKTPPIETFSDKIKSLSTTVLSAAEKIPLKVGGSASASGDNLAVSLTINKEDTCNACLPPKEEKKVEAPPPAPKLVMEKNPPPKKPAVISQQQGQVVYVPAQAKVFSSGWVWKTQECQPRGAGQPWKWATRYVWTGEAKPSHPSPRGWGPFWCRSTGTYVDVDDCN